MLRTARLTAIVVALLGVSFLVAAPGTATPAPSAARTWSAGTLVDPPRGGLSAVSCPTTTFCTAVDSAGNALTWDGTTWTAPVPVTGMRYLTSVSCPTTRLCVAADSAGNVATWRAGRWQPPVAVDPQTSYSPTYVSCAAATRCVAVGRSGNAELFDGSSWTEPDPVSSDGFNGISCGSVRRCLAVTDFGGAALLDGTTWTGTPTPSSDSLVGVSCASATFCVAVDSGSGTLTWRNGRWTSWYVQDLYNGFNAVACPTSSFCLATGNAGQHVVFQDGRWGDPVDDASDTRALDCPDASVCVGVSPTSSATFSGGSYSAAVEIDPYRGNPVAVSCRTTAFCAMLDTWSNGFVYDGTSWSAPVDAQPGPLFAYPIQALSCSSPTWCRGVTRYPILGNGRLITWKSTAWSATDPTSSRSYSDVSCVSPSFCVAVSSGVTVLGPRTVTTTYPISTTSYLTSVSCTSTSQCVVVTGDGQASSWNGTTWSPLVDVHPGARDRATQVSCASATFCTAVDSDGYASRWNGSTWSAAAAVDPGAALGDVTCVGTTCIAGDDQGRVVEFDGTRWAPPRQLAAAGDPVTSVSCGAATLCVAVTAAGYVFRRS